MIEIITPQFTFTKFFDLNETCWVGLAIFVTLQLIFVDTFLRVLVEARNFNIAMNREVSCKNMVKTILWQGWGSVDTGIGRKRFLMSRRLRVDMTEKLIQTYPWIFVLSFIVLMLPDVEMLVFGRIDVLLSTLLYMTPVFIELASCVENMIELEMVKTRWFKRAIELVKKLVAFVKTVKDAVK